MTELDLFGSIVPCAAQSATPCGVDEGQACRCGLMAEHDGPHRCGACRQMWHDAPAPPSGPQTAPFDREASFRNGARAFLASENLGRPFWQALQQAAHRAYGKSQKFSPRTFVAWYRSTYGVRINDHWSAPFADVLLERYPYLEAVIERRVRKHD